MRLFVTGAAGFIGSNLCMEFMRRGHEVVACDNFSNGTYRNLTGFRGQLLPKDICEIDENDLKGIDGFFHQAAISDPTVTDEKLVLETNLAQSVRLMKMCRQKGTPFIYASSAAVYGNTKSPNREFEAEKPHNVYAYSKLMLDYAARQEMGKSQIVGLRYFNVYGSGEEFKGKTASIAYHFLKEIMENRRPLIYGDGKQKRDFVYIKDVARANLLALESGKSGIVNVGSGKATEFRELAGIIAEKLGKKMEPVYKENPYQAYQYSTEADLGQAKKLIGYSPEWGIADGISDYVKIIGNAD